MIVKNNVSGLLRQPQADMQGKEMLFPRVAVTGMGGFFPFNQSLFALFPGMGAGAYVDKPILKSIVPGIGLDSALP